MPENNREHTRENQIRKIVKTILICIPVAIVALGLLFGSWYTLAEDDYAVVCTFGQVEVVEQ